MQAVEDGGKRAHWAWWLTRWVAVALALSSMAVIHVPELPFVGRWVYPYPYRAIIEREAHRRGLDPLLVAAIIRQESGFDPQARSTVGAMGLMQLMPNTARWAAGQLAIKSFKVEQLNEPETNIVLGTWYLAHLLRQFKDMDKVLAAYNGGEGNVSYWGTLRGEQLAYAHPETQSYVASCKRSYRRYQSLYAQPSPKALWPATVAARSEAPASASAALPEPSPPDSLPSPPPGAGPLAAPPSAKPPTPRPPRPRPPTPRPTLRPEPSAPPTATPKPPTARPVQLPRRVIRIPASPNPSAGRED